MPSTDRIFIGTDTRLDVSGIKDETDTLLTGTTTVIGSVWTLGNDPQQVVDNFAMPYTNTPGSFSGFIPRPALNVNQQYDCRIVATLPNGNQMTVSVKRTARYLSP